MFNPDFDRQFKKSRFRMRVANRKSGNYHEGDIHQTNYLNYLMMIGFPLQIPCKICYRLKIVRQLNYGGEQ